MKTNEEEAMTSHHDVAGFPERLRRRAAFILRWNDTSSPERHKTLESEAVETAPELIDAADLLESQAKALSEAERERAADNARLKIQRDNALLDMEAFMNKAEAAEASLAEAMKHINELTADLGAEIEGRYAGIKLYPSEARRYARDIATVIAARAFTNAAKTQESKDA